MDWLNKLFTETGSVAHAVLVLSLIAASGLAIGSIRVLGIRLGIAGVLFSGLLFGHFGQKGLGINHEVLEFCREFGLILFVYTIGVQVGPGFFAAFRRQGLPLNMLAASIVLTGAVIAVAIHYMTDLDIAAAVGLFSGATTNTPSLGAAQQALKDTADISPERIKLPGLAYAMAYPFGIIGIIVTMILVRVVFRIDPQRENEALARNDEKDASRPTRMNLQVSNPNVFGVPISRLPIVGESGVVISRILHNNELDVPSPETVLRQGDIILAVGPRDRLEQLKLVIGQESKVDLCEVPGNITSRRIIVTRRDALGKSVAELDLIGRYGVTITRASRAEIEFTPTPNFRLQFGDTLVVVGEPDAIAKVAAELGNSLKRLNHPEIVPIFVGIALGVIVGSWPLNIAGMPAAVKLGLAGGPLVVAILLSRIGRIGPLIWYMPISANFMLRELGIILFLACVGLRSGDQFLATLLHGSGLLWMGYGVVITLIPLLIAAVVGRVILKLNYHHLCGVLAGSMTDPPALAFATGIAGSDAPSVAYSTVYPLTMILRVLCAQLIVLLFA